MNAFLRAFTWWNSQTLNTQLFTWRKGVRVGEDDQGNIYYRTKDDKRRWVIFKGEAEASRINPEWHGWLHHTWNAPPNEQPLKHKSWEKPHEENRTGSALAYVPAGSLHNSQTKDRQDYEAWQPE
jgi:NADH:ubiquinone oxidoreductase subunit